MSRFVDLYDHIAKVSCTLNEFENIKSIYKLDIASRRTYNNCRSLAELLQLLVKRDKINEEDYTILEDIFIRLREKNITTPPWNSCQVPQSPVPSLSAAIPRPISPTEIISVLPSAANHISGRLYDIIANHIGHSWKNFARGLGISEGQIDELEDRHRTYSARIMDILNYHQHICPPHMRSSTLFNALCYARRNDLALKVQNLFDLHSLS